MKKKFVSIRCTLQHETPKAILLIAGYKTFWLPKSLIEFEKRPDERMVDVTIPEWLANEHGLT